MTIGQQSTLPLTIYNYGEIDLVIYDITCSHADFTTDFNPSSNVVTPGSDMVVNVTFTPTLATVYIEQLTIDNNDESMDVSLLGIGEAVGVTDPAGHDRPGMYALQGAYPNPFNPETSLIFTLPQAGPVSLVVYDAQGSEISRLAQGWFSAGYHTRVFDATGLPSGIYFARFHAGSFEQTQKLMLTK